MFKKIFSFLFKPKPLSKGVIPIEIGPLSYAMHSCEYSYVDRYYIITIGGARSISEIKDILIYSKKLGQFNSCVYVLKNEFPKQWEVLEGLASII